LAEIYLGNGRFADALALLEPLAATGPRDPQIKTLITKAKIGVQKSHTVSARVKGLTPAAEPEPPPAPLDPAGALQLFRDFAGVAGAAIVSREGLVLEQVSLPKSLAEAVGAVSSAIFGSTAASLPEPVFGSCEQLWIETDAARYWIARTGEKIWVVVCRPDINFGSFKLHAEEIKRRVRGTAPQPAPLEV
jgi:predicted regulator of Ras-like GTPase activity (Roadblock/LC7/MglB family)